MNTFIYLANKLLGDCDSARIISASRNDPIIRLRIIKYVEVEQCPEYYTIRVLNSSDVWVGDVLVQNTLRDVAEFHHYGYNKGGISTIKMIPFTF